MKENIKNSTSPNYEEYSDGKPNWRVVGPILVTVVAIIIYLFI